MQEEEEEEEELEIEEKRVPGAGEVANNTR